MVPKYSIIKELQGIGKNLVFMHERIEHQELLANIFNFYKKEKKKNKA